MKPLQNLPKNYLLAQLVFWGGYWLLNILYMSLYQAYSFFFLLLFIMLSLLMAGTSHLLRTAYHNFSKKKSIGFLCLNLLWLLPILALCVNALLSIFLFVLLKILPVFAPAVQRPYGWGDFFVYSINICIMLGFWSILYLLRAEFNKRRSVELDHWKTQAQVRELELQFLRSQINSHFLFNALNNLRALVSENPQSARQGLADLATLLRGILHTKATSTVTLAEELDWVRGYLALESLQFENRLEFEFDIDPDLLNAKLPPLLLQTLVENAIKHGIARRKSGGKMSINANKIAADKKNLPALWQLSVQNPPADINHSQAKTHTHSGNGIGLQNLRERLQVAFGDLASLELQLSDPVIARATLPLQ